MKKKLVLIYMLYIGIITGYIFLGNIGKSSGKVLTGAEIYYIDSDMLRLVSVDFECFEESPQKQAEQIVLKLIEGKDNNPKVRRMIPDIKDCIRVRVSGDTAYVDIKNKDKFPDGRVAECLIVYQIVNSLTSIDGVTKVKFSFDGKITKDFKGFIDMRETFIPDYYV